MILIPKKYDKNNFAKLGNVVVGWRVRHTRPSRLSGIYTVSRNNGMTWHPWTSRQWIWREWFVYSMLIDWAGQWGESKQAGRLKQWAAWAGICRQNRWFEPFKPEAWPDFWSIKLKEGRKIAKWTLRENAGWYKVIAAALALSCWLNSAKVLNG